MLFHSGRFLAPASHLKENVDDEDVEYVLEGDDNTVENSLEFGHLKGNQTCRLIFFLKLLVCMSNPVDCLQRPQHPEQLERLELLTRGGATAQGGKMFSSFKKNFCFFKKYLRQSVVEGYQRARDDGDVHEVPEVPEVGPGVEHHAKVQDLEHALQGEDGREAVVGLLQDLAFIYLK